MPNPLNLANTVQTAEAAKLAGGVNVAHSLSPIELFLQADIVVKSVMLILLLASVWCWAIIVDKYIRVKRVQSKADRFEESFWSGGSLEELFDRVGHQSSDPMTAVFAAAMREWRRTINKGVTEVQKIRTSLQQRIERVMAVTIQREREGLERFMGFLATVGSAATFIGLFGTVWGIMNSFQAIAGSQNTSLAVVAPGIAEALFATAIGLVAAIPAMVAYNKFSADLNRFGSRLDNFASEFSAIMSRQLEDK
jgi:biopolymer transport protein TolQ